MYTRVIFPDSIDRLSFFLAAEDYFMSREEEVFFLWRSAPTVIFGRNQVIEAEVNLPFCMSNGIALVRRHSGGGCVYSDKGNLMISLVCRSQGIQKTFSDYMDLYRNALVSAGIDCDISGRNDILCQGHKISGNAFHQSGDMACVHGTLLYNIDLNTLENAITPSKAKITSHGVDSTRSRVINLSEITSVTLEEISQSLYGTFCGEGRERTIGQEEIAAIKALEEKYLDIDYLYGRRHGYDLEFRKYIVGVGNLSLQVEMNGNEVAKVHLGGDYFSLREGVDEYLSEAMRGITSDALAGVNTSYSSIFEEKFSRIQEYILNLETKTFMTIFASGEEVNY